jgi:hypothetical protein
VSVKKGKDAASAKASQESKSAAKTHSGGCHCGKVSYEMTGEVGKAISCNCSICTKSGSLLSFIPVSQFTLLSGEDALIDYQFNRHLIHHMVCPDCGIKSFAKGVAPDGSKMIAVNLRCLDDIDLKSLEITEFDGRSL